MERRVAARSRVPPESKIVDNMTEEGAWEGARAWSYHFSGLSRATSSRTTSRRARLEGTWRARARGYVAFKCTGGG
jgi:hypothetical protein